MAEQELKIIEVTKGDKTYRNLDFRELEVDNFIVVEKTFAEGLEVKGKFGPMYSIGIKYKDQECSAFLSEKQHKEYKEIGGVGDKIKITKYEAKIKVKAGSMLVNRLKFELA